MPEINKKLEDPLISSDKHLFRHSHNYSEVEVIPSLSKYRDFPDIRPGRLNGNEAFFSSFCVPYRRPPDLNAHGRQLGINL